MTLPKLKPKLIIPLIAALTVLAVALYLFFPRSLRLELDFAELDAPVTVELSYIRIPFDEYKLLVKGELTVEGERYLTYKNRYNSMLNTTEPYPVWSKLEARHPSFESVESTKQRLKTAELRLSPEIDEIDLFLRTTVLFSDSDEGGLFNCETKFTELSAEERAALCRFLDIPEALIGSDLP